MTPTEWTDKLDWIENMRRLDSRQSDRYWFAAAVVALATVGMIVTAAAAWLW